LLICVVQLFILLGCHPAVDGQHRAGAERGLVACEEQEGVGDLRGLTHPVHRLARIQLAPQLGQPGALAEDFRDIESMVPGATTSLFMIRSSG
jgi:hypothetical protein